MVPLRSLPHAQGQLFALGHNGRPELDLMVHNPKKKRVVTPGLGNKSMKRKMVVIVDDNEEPEMAPTNVSIVNLDRTNIKKVHVLLLLDGLIGVLDSIFACIECGQSGTHTIKKVSVGIATSLTFFARVLDVDLADC
jgi:hypothetical protein